MAVVFPSIFLIQNFKVVVFPSNFWIQFFNFLKYYHDLTSFKSDFEFFSGMLLYLENKVGIVDFTKTCGLVKSQSPRGKIGPLGKVHVF